MITSLDHIVEKHVRVVYIVNLIEMYNVPAPAHKKGSCVSKTESGQRKLWTKPSFCLKEGGDCFSFNSTKHDRNTGKLKLD